MKVLVTGSEGFVGRNLVKYLKDRGFDVIGLDISGGELRLDVTDFDALLRSLSNIDFDAVVHLSAIANIPESIRDPYRCFKVNVYGTLNILEIASRKNVKRFIYASSANVYGLPLKLPVDEDTPLNPRTPYDYSKVAAETIVQSYWKTKKLPTVIFRSWKLFGEYDVPTTAIPSFIRACLKNETIKLYNSGRDTTDPTYIENYCIAIELALTREEAIGEVFNIGTGNEITIRQLAELIRKLTNSDSEIALLPPRTEEEKEPMRSYPSIEKIKKLLGYTPKTSLEEGLKRTIQYYKQLLEAETI
ncbi:MAG: GDP-mannose 4,6-dehydratase [Thaumarchaeota archaeon]|jgi:nucleoside-diphosphate-sugar epimerase|nr:GDP-mannose 4,6-dehydratase [Candidatus Geocrenenecus arthurdayi]MCL7390505.1 GDP-mannose 4,6-dehydratase [Candidatus Geocrenenecus arthurdayi]MCL7395975.1 GDP-mannose 4,6-dehydratase [Candidatus Geocrenenecus arthurdayi]MCL7403768.1 GDP-mannose 4,6-dehydratase [Candidatus Geocrenenecus arthurdayi]